MAPVRLVLPHPGVTDPNASLWPCSEGHWRSSEVSYFSFREIGISGRRISSRFVVQISLVHVVISSAILGRELSLSKGAPRAEMLPMPSTEAIPIGHSAVNDDVVPSFHKLLPISFRKQSGFSTRGGCMLKTSGELGGISRQYDIRSLARRREAVVISVPLRIIAHNINNYFGEDLFSGCFAAICNLHVYDRQSELFGIWSADADISGSHREPRTLSGNAYIPLNHSLLMHFLPLAVVVVHRETGSNSAAYREKQRKYFEGYLVTGILFAAMTFGFCRLIWNGGSNGRSLTGAVIALVCWI